MGTVVIGDVNSLIMDKTQQLIVKESGYGDAIKNAQNKIKERASEQLSMSAGRILEKIKKQVDSGPCSVDQRIDVDIPLISEDLQRMALTMSASAAAGTVIATGSGAAITTKLAAKTLTKVATKTAVKTAGGMAGAWAGAISGLSCGPYAPICASGLAIIGFVGVDALFIEGDEMLNREQKRMKMIHNIEVRRDEIKADLKNKYHKAGESFFLQVNKIMRTKFTPIVDGI